MENLFASSDPTVVFDQVVSYIKNSNLNFVSRETPFQCEVTLKKTFINRPKPRFQHQNSIFTLFTVPPPKIFQPKEPLEPLEDAKLDISKIERDELLIKLDIQDQELDALKSELSKSEMKNRSNRNTIEVLEEKLANAEQILYEKSSKSKKNEDDRVGEIKVLKAVIKNNNDEIAKLKMETKNVNTIFRIKDKEIYKLEAKAFNQEQTIATIKMSNNKFKNDIKKLNRSLKHKQIEAHAVSNHANPVYSCYICGKPLKNVEDMKDHVDKDHSDVFFKSDAIAKLPNKVKDSSEFSGSKNNNNLLACDNFGNKFAVLKHVIAHIKAHHNISVKDHDPAQTQPSMNSFVFKCPFCGNKFTCAAQLSDHTKLIHVQSLVIFDETPVIQSRSCHGRFSKHLEKTFNMNIGNTFSSITVRYERRCKESNFSVSIKIKNKMIHSKYLVHLKTKWQYAKIS